MCLSLEHQIDVQNHRESIRGECGGGRSRGGEILAGLCEICLPYNSPLGFSAGIGAIKWDGIFSFSPTRPFSVLPSPQQLLALSTTRASPQVKRDNVSIPERTLLLFYMPFATERSTYLQLQLAVMKYFCPRTLQCDRRWVCQNSEQAAPCCTYQRSGFYLWEEMQFFIY